MIESLTNSKNNSKENLLFKKETKNKSVNTIQQKEEFLDAIAALKHVSSDSELYNVE